MSNDNLPTPTPYFATYGKKLHDKGFRIVPILPFRKSCVVPLWNQLELNHDRIDRWTAGCYSDGGIGFRTGHGIVAIDIDIRDQELRDTVLKEITEKLGVAPVRTGQVPKCLLVYRTDEHYQKISTPKYTDHLELDHQVEILANGQYFVALGHHPNGNPYTWSVPPMEFEIKDLPVLSYDDALWVVDRVEQLFIEDGMEKVGGGYRGQKTNQVMSLVDYFKRFKSPLGRDVNQIQETLSKFTDPEHFSYPSWIRVGMGLWHEFQGDATGLGIWSEWSETDPNPTRFDPQECVKRWDSFRPNMNQVDPVTFRTVERMAKQAQVSRQCEVLSWDTISEIPAFDPPEFVVDRFMVHKTVNVMYGREASFKTFIALDMALSIAQGMHWAGFETKKGRVLYIAGEGQDTVRRRVRAWCTEKGVDTLENFMVSSKSVGILNKDEREHFINSMKKAGITQASMVVVDTLSRNFGGYGLKQENDTADMAEFVQCCEEISQELDCTVLLIHHKPKGGDTARGAVSLVANTYANYCVDREDDKAVLTCNKVKTGAEVTDLEFQVKLHEIGTDLKGRPWTEPVLVPFLFDDADIETIELDPMDIKNAKFRESIKEWNHITKRSKGIMTFSQLNKLLTVMLGARNNVKRVRQQLCELSVIKGLKGPGSEGKRDMSYSCKIIHLTSECLSVSG